MILDYLKKQNRPYSAIDVSTNLHNKVSKTQAAKTLKTLREANLIAGKDSGKQTVYHHLQPPPPTSSLSSAPESDLPTLDARITTLRASIADSKAEEKVLKAKVAAAAAVVSTEELRTRVAGLEKEKVELVGRVQGLKEGGKRVVGREEREAVEGGWGKWKKKADARKRILRELWGMLSEEVPEGVTRGEMWEEWGLEGEVVG